MIQRGQLLALFVETHGRILLLDGACPLYSRLATRESRPEEIRAGSDQPIKRYRTLSIGSGDGATIPIDIDRTIGARSDIGHGAATSVDTNAETSPLSAATGACARVRRNDIGRGDDHVDSDDRADTRNGSANAEYAYRGRNIATDDEPRPLSHSAVRRVPRLPERLTSSVQPQAPLLQ